MLTSFADTNLGYNLYKFFNGKYYIEVLYNTYLIPGALGLGYVVSKQLDRGLIEQIFGYGLTSGLASTSKQIGKLDDYTLPSYALYFALSLVILTILLIVPIVAVFNTSDTQSMFNMIYSLMDIRLILLFILTTIFVV